MLFKVLAIASEIRIDSNRQIVGACKNRIDMIWLLDSQPVPDQSALARFQQRCAAEIADLFCQYARLLEKQGETDHKRFSSTGRSRRISRTVRPLLARDGDVKRVPVPYGHSKFLNLTSRDQRVTLRGAPIG